MDNKEIAVMEQQQKLLVESWNAQYSIGQTVIIKLDNGKEKESFTLSDAKIVGGHTAVCFFSGIRGCYLLERARAI